MKRVLVTWVDSASSTRTWVDKGDAMGVVDCVSVGFLYWKDKKVVVLAQSEAEDQVGHLLAIPRIAVKSIRRLRVAG